VYELYLEHSAERALKKLPVEVFDKVIAVIKALALNARPAGCRKISSSKNNWRLRIEKYRVIYEVDDKAKEIRIMKVKHRREAY
jgi:mRNA interferase RelE/StbE